MSYVITILILFIAAGTGVLGDPNGSGWVIVFYLMTYWLLTLVMSLLFSFIVESFASDREKEEEEENTVDLPNDRN